MTNTELILNMLAEASTKDISQATGPKTLGESAKVAWQGGNVAKVARLEKNGCFKGKVNFIPSDKRTNMAKLSNSREKYLADKHFGAKNTKNVPPQLIEFGCRDCEISDEDLFFISQYVTDIGKLILGGTDVTETGLQYLKKIKTVEHLDLRSLPLNDNNLDSILHLKSLKYLYVKFTGLTANGIATILKSLPELQTLVAAIPEHEEHFIELWKRQYPTVELMINGGQMKK